MNGDAGRPGSDAPAQATLAGADLEHVVARLLTAGTYVSVAVLAVGTAMMLASGVRPLAGWTPFDLGQVEDDLVHLRAAGFLWLGLLAVVATPVRRVAASLVGYLRAGELLSAAFAILIRAVIGLGVGLARGLAA